MKALIVLSGNITNLNILRQLGRECDFILSADGGTNYCIKASVMPNAVIGDLDSISREVLDIVYEKNIPVEKFPVKKDRTDSELAIDYLIQKEFKDITLIGAIGSRMDHTLANLLLLNKLHGKGIKGKIVAENNIIYLVDNELIVNKEEDFYLSVIPITNSGTLISLKGFEYELDNIRIGFGSTRGISNKIVKDKGIIKVHEGKCLISISRD